MNFTKAFEVLKCLILNYNTYDIGSLDFISNTCLGAEDYDVMIEKQIKTMIVQIYERVRKDKNNNTIPETLSLIIIESLLFNIYSRHRNIDTFKLNNSFYNVSQASLDIREVNEYSMYSSSVMNGQEMKRFVNMVQRLANDKDLFRKINILIESKKNNQSINKAYLYNLLQTIDYIMTKEKMNKQGFFETKKIFGPGMSSSIDSVSSDEMHEVNSVIFSSQLNKIETLLQHGGMPISFALCRLYWANLKPCKVTRKSFADCKFNGQQMLFNLFKHYITSFTKKADLFSQSINPLYNLITNYLSVLFLPLIGRFVPIVNKCLSRVDAGSDAAMFFIKSADSIEKDLVDFISSMPNELWKVLTMVTRIISGHKWKDALDPSIPVKVLFLSRFLFDSRFLHIFFTDYDIQDYEKAANLLNILFYQQSIKNYNNIRVVELIKAVCQAFQNGLAYGNNEFEDESDQYFIEEPTLKFEYKIIANTLCLMEYTPKDKKLFDMTEPNADGIDVPNNSVDNESEDKVNADAPIDTKTSRLEHLSSPPMFSSTYQIPQQLEYNLYQLDWESRRKQHETMIRTKKEKNTAPFVTFNPEKKRQVIQSYVQYRLHRPI